MPCCAPTHCVPPPPKNAVAPHPPLEQEGNVTVVCKAPNTRDAIYRSAAEAASRAAQARDSRPLGDARPTRWVAALANDLGMDEERAVGIVQAVVAADSRKRIIEVRRGGTGWSGAPSGAGGTARGGGGLRVAGAPKGRLRVGRGQG